MDGLSELAAAVRELTAAIRQSTEVRAGQASQSRPKPIGTAVAINDHDQDQLKSFRLRRNETTSDQSIDDGDEQSFHHEIDWEWTIKATRKMASLLNIPLSADRADDIRVLVGIAALGQAPGLNNWLGPVLRRIRKKVKEEPVGMGYLIRGLINEMVSIIPPCFGANGKPIDHRKLFWRRVLSVAVPRGVMIELIQGREAAIKTWAGSQTGELGEFLRSFGRAE